MIPILTKDGLIPRRVARALGSAMWMYDLTGGFRIGKLHRRLKADEAYAHLPTMARDRIAGGYLYYDATTDDARLVLTVLRTAAEHGAAVANRGRVVELTKRADGAVDGAVVDAGGGARITVRARVVVNAAGVWSDDVRRLEDGVHPDSIRPAKGVHLTVPWDEGAQRHRRRHPGARRQAQPVRRPVGPARRRHVPAHLRRHDRHRLRRPARRPGLHRPTTSPTCCGR